MDTAIPPIVRGPSVPRFGTGSIVILLVLTFLGLAAWGITGYFRLSSETRALRASLFQTTACQWHQKVAVHVGGMTLSLARTALRWVRLPREPRAALEALHGAEVGVYTGQEPLQQVDPGTILSEADKSMAARGWLRAVGVAKEQELVAVYVPAKKTSPKNVKCCLLVLHGGTMVVAAARGNVQPLLELASARWDRNSAEVSSKLRCFLPQRQERSATE